MLRVEELRQRWQGVCVPLVTPFTEDGKPDLAALESNVQWLIDKESAPRQYGIAGRRLWR